ncbi:MAG: hypothetical protein WBP79_15015, partial [Candidatus Acidiferrales bacterium]
MTDYSGNITVIQKIQLPDGTSYQFGYESNSYGELTSIAFPNSGQVSYSYTNFADTLGNVNRWVSSRGSSGGTWSYSPQTLTSCPTGYSYCSQLNLTKPSGDTAVYTFGLSSDSSAAWNTGAIYYNGSALLANQVKAVSQVWTSDQLTSETTTMTSAAGAAISNTVQYSYTGPLLTGISEWKYYTGSLPSNPDRKTSISYYYGSGSAAINLINRPATTIVTDGAGSNVVAKTVITYDSYGSGGLTSVTGIKNHDDTNFGSSFTGRGNPTSIQRLVSGTSTYLTTSMT